MFPPNLTAQAEVILTFCRAKGLKIGTAESCTGGLIAGLLTSISGSSAVFERGWVTYSNEAKSTEIGVPASLIEQYGAVSVEVAQAMAEGILQHAPIDIALSITGIAGPGGATASKPVGLVYLGLAQTGQPTRVKRYEFIGDRTAIRMASVNAAMTELENLLKQ